MDDALSPLKSEYGRHAQHLKHFPLMLKLGNIESLLDLSGKGHKACDIIIGYSEPRKLFIECCDAFLDHVPCLFVFVLVSPYSASV
jgi:hypothetical protein